MHTTSTDKAQLSSVSNKYVSDGIFFGLGHPLLDISTQVSTAFLQRYDLQANSVALAQNVPKYDEILTEILSGEKHQLNYSPGGSTQNTLKTINWLLRQGSITTCMGCVGQDESGRRLEAQMNNCLYQKKSNAPTATCLILITDQARSMITNLGAANEFTIDHLNAANNWQHVERAQIFYVPGFFLRTCFDAVFKLADHAAKTKKIFALNLSAEYICQNFGNLVTNLLPFVDVLFGNEQEARSFAQSQMNMNDDIVIIAKELQKRMIKSSEAHVIITRGADPVILASKDGVRLFTIKKPSHIVDTIGCGDAFVGGFLAYRSLNSSLDDCINAACYCAYECLLQIGCQFPKECLFNQKERFCTIEHL